MKYYKFTHDSKFYGKSTKVYKYINGKQYCYYKGNWYITDRIFIIPNETVCGFSSVLKEDLEEITEQEAFLELI